MTLGDTTISQLARGAILGLLLCLTVLAVFVPLNPVMPSPQLDSSWMFAMNQGVARGLVFGKDIVFTFGPYGSIYTELYDPATDWLMLYGSLFLGLCYAFLLLQLGWGAKAYKLLLYGIFLACLMDSRDALLFSYPLILALVVYRVTLPDGHAFKLRLPKEYERGWTILFAPLGLLPLIKGSLLPICGITAMFCFAILWFNGSKTLAWLAAIVPVISSALAWPLSGQPLLALLDFYMSSRQFISGYTEAMSYPGDIWECVFYAISSAVIIFTIARSARGPKSSTGFLCAVYAFFLFIAFKAGFVRHDPWHNVTAGSSLLAAALLLMFVLDEMPSLMPLGMALLAWAYIGHGTRPSIAADITANLRSTFVGSFQGARERWHASGDLRKRYDQHLAAIRIAYPIPQMPGTMDIYSFNQSWLLASDNDWSPRPVTQSYSAYTPALQELNLRHLQGSSAPDNILFRVEPIDGRLASLEDGLSWPTLINNYSLQKLDGASAYLRKMPIATEKNDAEVKKDFQSANHDLGEEVPLPDSSDPLFARMEITPTFLGKVLGALFKPPELHITMHLRSGNTANYRVISTMMQTDFLITPLIRSTEDFALLKAGGNKFLIGNQVKSFQISADDDKGLFWNKSYSLQLAILNLAESTEAENAVLFDQIDDAVAPNHLNLHAEMCEGAIEAVNGTSPHFEIPAVGNALSVRGWMAISGKDGIVPDHVFVTLTDQSGKTFFIKPRSIPRPDISGHFNQPTMPDPGFTALVDVASLHGKYTMGLAHTYKGTFGSCEQFKLPILIAR